MTWKSLVCRLVVSCVLVLVVGVGLGACGALSVSAPSGPAAANPDVARLRPIIEAELAGQTPPVVRAELESVPPLGIGQATVDYPAGLPPASVSNLFSFTPDDIAKLKAGHHTAGIAMHLMNDAFPRVQVQAITSELGRFGITVVATTDANDNASKQVDNLGTLIARHPDVIFSEPVNPTTEGAAYRQVTASGIKLVLLDDVPNGLRAGKDFVTVVSANNHGDAEFATQRMVDALRGKGQVGQLNIGYYYFVVTTRDQATSAILGNQPAMSVVSGSFSEPSQAAYNEASGMLLAHPDMQGMWAAWDTVATQVVAAERSQGRKIYLVTSDLGVNSGLLMAEGYIQAIGAQQPYAQGIAEADAAAYSLLGKRVPPYLELPTVPVTLETLLPAYRLVLHREPPAQLVAALKQTVGISGGSS
jgi:ribose transport system substrate-binding protein